MSEIKLLDGSEWTKKNLIKEMRNDEFYYDYLGKVCLSASAIKKLYRGEEAKWSGNSSALREGSLIHLMTLEPEREKELILSVGTRGQSGYKLLKTSKVPLSNVYTLSEYNRCKEIAQAVHNDFEASLYLDGSKKEIPEIAMLEGIPVRAKADILMNGTIIDLKTTAFIDTSEDSLLHFGYDIQGALYVDVFGADGFGIIWVDKKTLEVKIQHLTPQEIEEGRIKYKEVIKNIKDGKIKI